MVTPAKQPWKVERMWEGQTVAILASGHSMNCEVVDRLRQTVGVRVLAVNNNYKLCPWADLFYAADAEWWRVHAEKALKLHGLKVCAEPDAPEEVLWIRVSGERGFDPNPAFVRTGSNSGYQAVHIAIHAGAKRILLCGFNLSGKHWHPEHKKPLKVTEPERYKLWLPRFSELQTQAPKEVEILNCTPGSALKCFPFVDLEAALKKEGEKCVAQCA